MANTLKLYRNGAVGFIVWLDLAMSLVLCMPFSHCLVVGYDFFVEEFAAMAAESDALYWVSGDSVKLSFVRRFSPIANAKIAGSNVLLSLCSATCPGSGRGFWAVDNARLLQCDFYRIVATSVRMSQNSPLARTERTLSS